MESISKLTFSVARLRASKRIFLLSAFSCWRCARHYADSSTLTLTAMRERGLIQSLYPESKADDLTRLLHGSAQRVYSGFDPTADSLHTGNLLVIMALIYCQRAGHSPIAVLGGATGLIGDPSGKQTDRPCLEQTVLDSNLSSLRHSIERLFTNHAKYLWRGDRPLPEVRILNNAEWYADQNVIEFFSVVGRQFRLRQMMHRSSVRSRLESEDGMNFSEFSYQLFQAYDWLHLNRTYNCRFQIGGNDQIGNMAAGYELVKKVTNKSVYGLTVPLLTAAGGQKVGKSEGNATWLDAQKTSPYELYQVYLNCSDDDVENHLKLFTVLPKNELTTLMAHHRENPGTRRAQKKLAEQVVQLVHGDSGLESARRCTGILFKSSTDDLFKLDEKELLQLFKNSPHTRLQLEAGTTLLDMVLKAKCFTWDEDAERIIKAGGVYINLQRCNNPDMVLVPGQHVMDTGFTVVRIGKKSFHIVQWIR